MMANIQSNNNQITLVVYVKKLKSDELCHSQLQMDKRAKLYHMLPKICASIYLLLKIYTSPKSIRCRSFNSKTKQISENVICTSVTADNLQFKTTGNVELYIEYKYDITVEYKMNKKLNTISLSEFPHNDLQRILFEMATKMGAFSTNKILLNSKKKVNTDTDNDEKKKEELKDKQEELDIYKSLLLQNIGHTTFSPYFFLNKSLYITTVHNRNLFACCFDRQPIVNTNPFI
eukprot:64847_1